ncbi:MAG: ankyrin repeat domain-containing protein [Allomuricauda sp.]|nr:MAG: ankyrin repeat domain-containing protein [Allomuricauda sp.]
MNIKILPFVFLFTLSLGYAQENVFLQRSFWKENPSIAEIEKAIAAGNDATELNRNLFDGVCYAFLEQVDNTSIIHLLGKKGNEVDKITHDGRTYIFWAAYKGNLEMVKWLVAHGARADIEDAHGYSVLNFAANAGQSNTALYDFLLAHKADINATTRSGANALLLAAASAKNEKILNYFMDKGLSFESLDDADNGIFQLAARGGNIQLLKMLAAKGADVNRVNKNGENALFMAAQGSRSKQHGKLLFDYLEGLGLDANLTNKSGRNLLHVLAVRNNNMEVYEHFIKKGLDINTQDVDGNTPLHNAARGNSLEVVQLFSNQVEDVNTKDNKGRTALAMAVSRNKPEIVELLLKQGAGIAATDNNGNTLAFYLKESYNAKSPEAFEAKWALLNKAGLLLTEAQHEGNTLLHLAAKDNNLALLQRLEGFGFDINQKNDEGITALHLAAMSTTHTDILKYLISKGADVSLKTDFEETVYDLAKENELLQEQNLTLDFLKS